MKNSFNVNDYLPQVPKANADVAASYQPADKREEVEIVINRIEDAGVCIASDYGSWLRVCYAFIDEFGEGGRDYFRRISRFWRGKETRTPDMQFDRCLESENRGGSGVTIATFFELAKQAGVDVAMLKEQPSNPHFPSPPHYPSFSNNIKDNTPYYYSNATSEGMRDCEGLGEVCTFSDRIKEYYPELMKAIVMPAKDAEEADALFLSSQLIIASAFDNYRYRYMQRDNYANQFLFLCGKPGAGKGIISDTWRLIEKIHQEKREKYEEEERKYKLSYHRYMEEKKENPDLLPPEKPKQFMHKIPVDNSAANTRKILKDNNGIGLMFATEAKKYIKISKKEYGDYRDLLLLSYHAETDDRSRSTNQEYTCIDKPRLSVVFSGVFEDLIHLFPEDDGLESRFMKYLLSSESEWKNPFDGEDEESLDEYYTRLGERVYQIAKKFEAVGKVQFKLSKTQQYQFNNTYKETHTSYKKLYGQDSISLALRMAHQHMRIAMTLTALRYEDKEIPSIIDCDDTDFLIAREIVEVLKIHANNAHAIIRNAYRMNRSENEKNCKHKADIFIASLPENFTTKEAIEKGKTAGISQKSIERYLTSLLGKSIQRIAQGEYRKIEK